MRELDKKTIKSRIENLKADTNKKGNHKSVFFLLIKFFRTSQIGKIVFVIKEKIENLVNSIG